MCNLIFQKFSELYIVVLSFPTRCLGNALTKTFAWTEVWGQRSLRPHISPGEVIPPERWRSFYKCRTGFQVDPRTNWLQVWGQRSSSLWQFSVITIITNCADLLLPGWTCSCVKLDSKHLFFVPFGAAAAARGGGDVGLRESGTRHERSAESCSVRRIQQDRRHRTVRHWGHTLLRLRLASTLLQRFRASKMETSGNDDADTDLRCEEPGHRCLIQHGQQISGWWARLSVLAAGVNWSEFSLLKTDWLL